MVKLPTVQSANVDLVSSRPLVAVFAGGSSGIGEYTARALAKTHGSTGKGLRVYIVGRNEAAAQIVVADCQQLCPDGQFKFVKATDLALLKEVDEVCEKIIALEQKEKLPRIDILFMTQACPPWRPPQETTEGLDTLMSLMYYSRMRMTTKLLPLLCAAAVPAHVISVYAAGMEAKLLEDDFSLRKPGNYSMFQARSHVVYMKAIYMEHLARENPGKLSLVHVFPSLVETPAFKDPQMPGWLKFVWDWFGKMIIWAAAVPAEECGARMLYLATARYPAARDGGNRHSPLEALSATDLAKGVDGEVASGVYSINWNGESCSTASKYSKLDKEVVSRRMVEHTNKAFEEIEHGRKFEG